MRQWKVWRFCTQGYTLYTYFKLQNTHTHTHTHTWLSRHVVSAESIDSFKRRLDQSMDRDDRWDG